MNMMDKIKVILVTAITVMVATFWLKDPVSVALFHIREPHFIYPIKIDSGQGIVVRNDAGGDGEFGSKRRGGRSHAGIDIQAPVGTPIMAAKSGLAFCLNVPTGYGKYILIYHPDGMLTIYGHLSEWKIESATRVKQGDVIGFVGKTGNAGYRYIEPHLHFEIRKDNVPQDPRGLMR